MRIFSIAIVVSLLALVLSAVQGARATASSASTKGGSRFQGTFDVPTGFGTETMRVDIAKNGTFSGIQPNMVASISIDGRIKQDGSMEYVQSIWFWSSENGQLVAETHVATGVLDGSGNLVVTDADGTVQIWTRIS